MITTIIAIGNSRGIRIPKPMLNESGLGKKVELRVKKGEIKIVPVPPKNKFVASTLLMSEKTLGTDWDRPEEDKAWASIQPSALRP